MYNDAIFQMDAQLQMKEGRQSGLQIHFIREMVITLSKCEVTRGSSWIKFRQVVVKKDVTNIRNKHDNKCFAYSVARWLNPIESARNPGHVTLELKEHLRKLNWDGVEFPTPLRGKSISNFEKITKELSWLLAGMETTSCP